MGRDGFSFAVSSNFVYGDLVRTMLSHRGMYSATVSSIYRLEYRVIDLATILLMSIGDAAIPRFSTWAAAD
jgi:hypothetical protein